MDQVKEVFLVLRHIINYQLKDYEPLVIVLVTLATAILYHFLKSSFSNDEPILVTIERRLFNFAVSLPFVRTYFQQKIQDAVTGMTEEVQSYYNGLPFIETLPDHGWEKDKIFQKTDEYNSLGLGDWSKGRVSGTVYNYQSDLVEVTTGVYNKCAWTNPLHMDVFPGIFKMEAEVVRMVCNMFNGGPETCGVISTGGTESILLACKAYRDRALKLGIKEPQIVAPMTAHAAFNKAATFMNAKITSVPVNPKTLQVDIKAMERAITKNTCMLVASAPQYPHGVIDPVEDVAKLGLKYKIPVHVDSCLGGFLLPFMEKAGFPLPSFDFRVPGVTSISCDTHKYGAAPKGTSVLMYRNRDYRQYQYFVVTDWPGGVYASPSLPGSRSGGVIATCWATMLKIGQGGYIEMARKVITTTRKLIDGLKKIPHIHVLGDPKVSVVAIASDDFNIYRLSDDLKQKGWLLNVLQYPSSVHICVTMMHTEDGVAEDFLKDVRESVKEIMKNPTSDPGGKCALYGMAQRVPDRSVVSVIASSFIDACYSTSSTTKTKDALNKTTSRSPKKKKN
ncbi:Sphingosine-1-phosphate lyase 1 [Chamberlinius hualienensis]